MAPITDALERHAAAVGGAVEWQIVRKDTGTLEAGSVLLSLKLEGLSAGEMVDEDTVQKMRWLVHERYSVYRDGKKTGLLLEDAGLPEHERRAIEKERSLRKKGKGKGRNAKEEERSLRKKEEKRSTWGKGTGSSPTPERES